MDTVSATSTSSAADNIYNAETLFDDHPAHTAFDDIGALDTSFSQSFDFGLPFFFGREVYVAIDGQSTSAGDGPYFAY